MNDLVKAIEAADDGWALAAIALLGLYVLLWKFGGELLSLARDSNKKANQAHEKVVEIKKDLNTNHGSKSIGDAIDKLTESVALLSDNVADIRQEQRDVKQDLQEHIAESMKIGSRWLDRLDALENKEK